MLKDKQLQDDLILLLKSGRWDMVEAFFSNCRREEELIDKVLLWGHFFLPHYFRDSSPEFHRELILRFFSEKNEYTAAPRGFSKTTIIQTCIMFSVVNKLDKFIVLIEKNFTEAAEVLRGVHDEFLDNKRILLCYGEMIGKKDIALAKLSILKNKDAQGDTFINGVRLRGKGFNSTIRGLKSRQWRPTTIILDDVEEDDHINNPEQREKYLSNYNKGVQPAVDITGSIKIFGTILHQDSLLKNLIDSHKGKIFRAYDTDDPENTLLWESRWNFKTLEAKKKDMTQNGRSANAFAQEYLNDPISDDERVFKFDSLWEMISDNNGDKYRVPRMRITMEQLEEMRKKTTFTGYAMIDVADTVTPSADYTGMVVHFVDPFGNRYRVDVRREKRNINGVIDLIFEIWKKWQPYGLISIGIEKKGFEDQIVPLYDIKKEEYRIYPVIEELKPMGRNKQDRIRGALEGLYESGKVYSVGRIKEGKFISIRDTDKLLDELYDFPSAKNDDISDAEAYSADIVKIPTQDTGKKTPHHDPEEDPFKDDIDLTESNMDPY